jgi:tetratricopeptide (TPR) repeat protein
MMSALLPDESLAARAVRQALYHLSRGSPLPADNLLLWSPLVTQYLHDIGAEDTPEERAVSVQAILRQILNEYALEEPEGRRQQTVQQSICDLLLPLLRGQSARSTPRTLPKRSYERYHADGIRMLAARFIQRQAQLLRKPGEGEAQALHIARQKASECVIWLEAHPGCLDIFVMTELAEAASLVADQEYYSEALPYFERLQTTLQAAPHNRIMARSTASALRGLAHCCMNVNAVGRAIGSFSALARCARDLGDWETWLHATHLLGVTYDLAGDWPAAAHHFARALAEVRKGPDTLARTAWIQRDLVHARMKVAPFDDDIPALAKASLATRQQLGDAQGCMMTLEVWGRALIAQERYREASIRLEEALALAGAVRSPLFHTILLTTLARLHLVSGQSNVGAATVQRARTVALRHGFWRQLATLDTLGGLAQR